MSEDLEKYREISTAHIAPSPTTPTWTAVLPDWLFKELSEVGALIDKPDAPPGCKWSPTYDAWIAPASATKMPELNQG